MHTSLAVELKAHTSLRQEHFQRSSGPERFMLLSSLQTVCTLNDASLKKSVLRHMIEGTCVLRFFLWHHVEKQSELHVN